MKEKSLVDKIMDALNDMRESKDFQATSYVPLGVDDDNIYAIVIAWMDYDNTDDWTLYAKLAYQPKNSLMQEYDIDWLMPIDDNGDVIDTEISNPDIHDIGFLVDSYISIIVA